MPDGIRRVDGKAAAGEEAALDDVLFIGTLAPGAERAGAQRRHPAEHGHVLGGARRARRFQRPAGDWQFVHFGYAHATASPLAKERYGTASKSILRPQSGRWE